MAANRNEADVSAFSILRVQHTIKGCKAQDTGHTSFYMPVMYYVLSSCYNIMSNAVKWEIDVRVVVVVVRWLGALSIGPRIVENVCMY